LRWRGGLTCCAREESKVESKLVYSDRLGDLIELLKLPTGDPAGSRVRDVLNEGDETQIREMLFSLGNPETEWGDIKTAPWTEEEFIAAKADMEQIKETSPVAVTFWAW